MLGVLGKAIDLMYDNNFEFPLVRTLQLRRRCHILDELLDNNSVINTDITEMWNWCENKWTTTLNTNWEYEPGINLQMEIARDCRKLNLLLGWRQEIVVLNTQLINTWTVQFA